MTLLNDEQLDFESLSIEELLRWANLTFKDDLILAASFQDVTMIDIVTKVIPDIKIVFIDTGSHFKETTEFVNYIKNRYNLNLIVVKPDVSVDEYPCGSGDCCKFRKVEPFNKYLKDYSVKAWISGIKRVDTPERADAPVVGWDDSKGLYKINPIVTWDDSDVEEYSKNNMLPQHPLVSKGYLSIGCAPTTHPVEAGKDTRSGRWANMDKTECGLHI